MTDMPHYGVANGELLVFDETPRWSGRIDGRPVVEVVALAGTDDAVARVDPLEIDDRLEPYSNLFRVDHRGRVVWRAELPLADDWTDGYVGFQIVDGELKASSWSCYAVSLDLETGSILSKRFTK